MRAFDQHEAWEMKPRKLSSEEVEHPELVLEDLFQYAHLPQLRWYYWESMKSLITGSFVQMKSRERANMIYFYEQIEKLIEAVHLIHEQNKQRNKG